MSQDLKVLNFNDIVLHFQERPYTMLEVTNALRAAEVSKSRTTPSEPDVLPGLIMAEELLRISDPWPKTLRILNKAICDEQAKRERGQS